ncbi:MAG: aminotransferase class I/II-fold pyridoxal phosphate-dependent enzyme [Lachnospiraceae bacterium]|nr:aminotransferase class I/II-fold pyridoxal phosphate-dependent enzyme [Lachnospiraceae bacterium]
MQAIILAAGMGKRLKEYTSNNTKCMVSVCGHTLIERALTKLHEKGLSRVVIVIGYKGRELQEYIESLNVGIPIVFIDNPIYDKTNNIYSLYLAKDYLCEEDTILLESDIIFESSVLDALLDDERESLVLVDKYKSWMDGTCLKLSDDDTISDFISGKKLVYTERDKYYKTVNIYKFSKEFSTNKYVPFLEAYSKALGNNEYYEQVLKVLAVLEDSGIYAKRLNGQKWYEIDDALDLDIAESMFSEGKTHLNLMEKRYGGYWRYPDLLDFCYLVNPYFPPRQMKEEMKASYEDLLCAYPSGMSINSLLASKNLGIKQNKTVVGNGAAELIKALMEHFDGTFGIIRPSFEEYGHRVGEDRLVVFTPDNADFSYTCDDVIAFFGNKSISNLVIINPDNPSGNYLCHADVLRLFDWAAARDIRLIYDESFSDFSTETVNTVLSDDILEKYPSLYVVKSFSKSYGVPGLRLGILASADTALIDYLKKDVAIWNINSFAEHFMQILGKYEKFYALSTEKLAEERDYLTRSLSGINGIRVIPSQANYVMAELTGSVNSETLTLILLEKHNILIKNLAAKTGGNYMRIAVRDRHDNDLLLAALKEEL